MKFCFSHAKALPLPPLSCQKTLADCMDEAEFDALIAEGLELWRGGVWPVFGFGNLYEDPAWIDRRCGVMPAEHSRGG